MAHPVYLDNAATTPLDPRVLEAMLPHLGGRRGNPSSLHALGASAREAVEEARGSVAALSSGPSIMLLPVTSACSRLSLLHIKWIGYNRTGKRSTSG